MVNFLAKIFIKNYKSINNEKVRTAYGVLASAFGIFTNVILVAIKLTLGIFTFSISIIADAVNNISDIFTSIIGVVGFKISSRPADSKHPFGHQRVEYVLSLIVAMIISFVGVELMKESINKIINPVDPSLTYITYILLGVSILIKIVQGIFYLSTSKKINSLALKGSSRDSFNDVIATSAVLLGAFLSKLFKFNLDGYLGCAVSIFILVSSLILIKETIDPLVGEKPDSNLINQIVKDIKSQKGIYDVHEVIAHLYGPSKIFITLHCEVDSKVDALESHEIIDEIEHKIKEKYDVEIVIHMDPIVIDDPEINMIKDQIKNVLTDIDPRLKFHDFRMTKGKIKYNLIFDVVVPYSKDNDLDSLSIKIEEGLKKINKHYNVVINFDNDYIGE